MSDNVVKLHTAPVQQDIVAGLRGVADALEAEGPGAYGMETVTTAVLVLGTSAVRRTGDDEELEHTAGLVQFSWGPRMDTFTVTGLLTLAAAERSMD